MVLWGPFLSLDRETRGKVLQILVCRRRRRLRRRLGQRGEEYATPRGAGSAASQGLRLLSLRSRGQAISLQHTPVLAAGSRGGAPSGGGASSGRGGAASKEGGVSRLGFA